MTTPRSPLAPENFPSLPAIAGVTLRVACARYKDWDRCDLTYVELAPGTAVAGVFTRNICCSSEVELGREQVKDGVGRALRSEERSVGKECVRQGRSRCAPH